MNSIWAFYVLVIMAHGAVTSDIKYHVSKEICELARAQAAIAAIASPGVFVSSCYDVLVQMPNKR